MTVHEFAKESGLSPSTVRRLCEAGEIQAWRPGPGHTWDIPQRELHRYIGDHQVDMDALREEVARQVSEGLSEGFRRLAEALASSQTTRTKGTP